MRFRHGGKAEQQRAFETSVRHLRKQGCRAATPGGTCLYRGPENTMCAVGCLVGPVQYGKIAEGSNARQVCSRLWPGVSVTFVQLLMQLQEVHDNVPVERWETHFAVIAVKFGLTVPAND